VTTIYDTSVGGREMKDIQARAKRNIENQLNSERVRT